MFHFRNRPRCGSPIMHRPVQKPGDREIGATIGKVLLSAFVIGYTETWAVAYPERSAAQLIRHIEHFLAERWVGHVLLDSKVVDRKIEMQGSCETHRRDVAGTMHP